MGTSSLYGGPKKTVLLPTDYDPDEALTGGESGEEQSDEELQDANQEQESENQDEETSDTEDSSGSVIDEPASGPIVSWQTVRRSMTHAMSTGSRTATKTAIRRYTKALGGHTNATRQAKKARSTAVSLLNYFTGTSEEIRARFEEAGVQFDGRSTKEILSDICGLIAPVPNDLEDSLADRALNEVATDVALDTTIDLNQLDGFNEELLQRMVGGFIKHYIYDKLIMQSEQGALNRCDNPAKLKNLEKGIQKYINGIVDGVIGDIVRSGLSQDDFNRAVDTLFDAAYQQMEELR